MKASRDARRWHIPSKTLFFSLRPEDALSERVHLAKRLVQKQTGFHQYVEDPPHMTLFLSVFASERVAIDALHRASDMIVAPSFEVAGLHAFLDDPLTGNDTLVVDIAPTDKERLRSIQAIVVGEACRQRDVVGTVKYFQSRLVALSSSRQLAVREYGFPYIGGDWQPHLTIAAVKKGLLDGVLATIEEFEWTGRFCGAALELFRLEGSEPILIASRGLQVD